MSAQLKCVCTGLRAYPAVKHPERCKKFRCPGCSIWQPYCCGGRRNVEAL
jgi:hypothetical protein